MKLKTIRDIKNIKHHKVLLRVDYNVGLMEKNGKLAVKDDYRIVVTLPTIRYLLRYGCTIVIISHLGEPANTAKDRTSYSLEPVARRLAELLDKPVEFIGGNKLPEPARIADLAPGSIVMLENLRFNRGEKSNDSVFAAKLAGLLTDSDNPVVKPDQQAIYVNEAFSVCHRDHASVSAIKQFLPSFAGLLLEKECANLDKVLNPVKPAVAVMGGSKISTKLALIKNLTKKFDHILIGGAMANNFFKARGIEVGRSLVSNDEIGMAQKLSSRKIILPVDVIVCDKPDGKGRITCKSIKDVGKEEIIYDIGPETVRAYSKYIKQAKTIIWNGPLGKYELAKFKHGTNSTALLVAARSSGRAFGVVGGGETIDALNQAKMAQHVDWVSTGGGAMLAYLGNEPMPGLIGLY